jgi:hypothetical protein
MKFKFEKMWLSDKIFGLDVDSLQVSCVYIKKTNKCYTSKIQFMLDTKIQFVYENNHSRSNPEFQAATTMECAGSYVALYSEQTPYENNYLYVLRKIYSSEKFNETKFATFKNIIDVLFSDYCEFVL